MHFRGDFAETETVVMRSKTGTVRRIKTSFRMIGTKRRHPEDLSAVQRSLPPVPELGQSRESCPGMLTAYWVGVGNRSPT